MLALGLLLQLQLDLSTNFGPNVLWFTAMHVVIQVIC